MRTAVEAPTREPGGVLVRGLLGRLSARREPMPLVQAVAIVLGATARVRAAHAAGTRALTAPETVLVRFDGVVVVGGVRVVGGDREEDLAALTRLLGELVAGNQVPDELAQVIAGTFVSAAELSRALAASATACDLAPSRAGLGSWAKRQVYPPRFAHTLRRDDVPELGVDIGRAKPKPVPAAELANGSGKFDLDEVEMDVELDVDLDDLVDDTDVWTGTPALDPADAIAIGARGTEPPAGARPLVVLLFAIIVVGAVVAFVMMQPR